MKSRRTGNSWWDEKPRREIFRDMVSDPLILVKSVMARAKPWCAAVEIARNQPTMVDGHDWNRPTNSAAQGIIKTKLDEVWASLT
jgi:hypothetical protein